MIADAAPFDIRLDDATGPEIAALIALHLAGMHGSSPPESVHALGLEALRAPDVTLWTLWEGDALLGCGALKQIAARHGEIKSMRTAPSQLGRGVGAALLSHIIAAAEKRGYERLSLETGSGAAFEPAHRLYLRFGFAFCGPFGGYVDDPFSRFMTRSLARLPVGCANAVGRIKPVAALAPPNPSS